MTNATLRIAEPVLPAAEEVVQAQEAAHALARFVAETPKAQLSIEDSTRRMHVVLPRAAVLLLQGILREMAQGHAVTSIPVQAKLTTQQAACGEFASVFALAHRFIEFVRQWASCGLRQRPRTASPALFWTCGLCGV